MLSVLRVIVAVVISRGAQNSQTMHQARQFLKDTRASIVAIFKRHAKVGGIAVEGVGDLSELVDAFTLLISATGFLEVRLPTKSSRDLEANHETARRSKDYAEVGRKYVLVEVSGIYSEGIWHQVAFRHKIVRKRCRLLK